jgi:hypothetical protein
MISLRNGLKVQMLIRMPLATQFGKLVFWPMSVIFSYGTKRTEALNLHSGGTWLESLFVLDILNVFCYLISHFTLKWRLNISSWFRYIYCMSHPLIHLVNK